MKKLEITVIHGQHHKGITYTITHKVLDKLVKDGDKVNEFFLPDDGPGFCVGCNSCFLRGEENCPCADKAVPIMHAIERSDIIIADTPNYCLEMSGALKNLFDHFAYRWVTHRPHGSMFSKTALAVCSSAGAPANGTVKSIAKQFKWMCIPKVFLLPFTASAMTAAMMNDKKKAQLEVKAAAMAKKLRKRAENPHPSLRSKLFFNIFKKMQSAPASAWNPTDRDWWINQGWTKGVKPWKSGKADKNDK